MNYQLHIDNLNLQRFELKPPDYAWIDRGDVPLAEAACAPRRYKKKESVWVSKERRKDRVRILFTGDITCFAKQFAEAWNGTGYDFHYAFDEIRPIFSQADLVVGNLETMIVPCAPYRSEKLVSEQNYYCNAPLEFLDAVRGAGFDLVTNANNHDMDTGAVGIGETIDHIESFGLIQTGTFKKKKRRYELFDVCGFKVAVVAFATDHNNKKCNLTRDGQRFLLQDYSAEKAARLAAEARENGAEIVIASIHWGIEHKAVQSPRQEATAAELAQNGYDCVIGSHPHVLQPYAVIRNQEKAVPVFYSLGNFVSHNEDNARARSAVACIDLSRGEGGVELTCSCIPVYTSCEFKGKKFAVLPIPEKPALPCNKEILSKIMNDLGSEIKITPDLRFEEQGEVRRSAETLAEKLKRPNLAKILEYPFSYVSGSFRYDLYKDHACVTGLMEGFGSGVMPEKVLGLPITEIKEGAFARHASIGKLNFNPTVTRVSKGLFRGCPALEGVRLGIGVSEICEEAFADCKRLSCAVMRAGVVRIGPRAFLNCENLISVKIPANVTEIADDAFEGCEKVTIYCESGSCAEAYAARLGLPYVIMPLGKQ